MCCCCRLANTLRDGSTRDRPGCRRASNLEGLYAFGAEQTGTISREGGPVLQGSITAFYTVLMEGDDQNDPVVDTVRSLLDGHIVVDRELAARNHYPPISILDSLSRLMPSVSTPNNCGRCARQGFAAAYARSEDLIRIGAYQHGSDATLDKAIATHSAIQRSSSKPLMSG